MPELSTETTIDFHVECSCGGSLDAIAFQDYKGGWTVRVNPCQSCIDEAVADAKEE